MKAVIYARYSSDSQREESIEGQLRECAAFAEKNGITVLRHYIDRAYSAKTDNRPEFQNMIKDSGKRLFDIVIVWKLDRFARNRYDSARYKATLKKNGVKVVSATEIISEGAEGIILESVLEGYAEYYSADLSEKVVRGMTDNALKCKFNGGTMPIGYVIDAEQHFRIDPLTAPFVLETFKRYDGGETISSIMNWLNEQGLTNTRGQKMTFNSVGHILHNRRYIGEFRYRDVIVPDGIPAIVPQDLFDRVQEKLAKNKKAPARHKAEDDYLLTTKLFCGYCGAYLCGESGTSRTGKVHHYYKCVSVKKKRTECHKKPVRKKWIEDLVVGETMKMVMDDKAIEAIVSMLMDLQDRDNVNVPLYEQQLREAETAISNLLNAIQQGVLTRSTKERLEELENRRDELENRLACEKLAKPKVSAEFMTFWLHRFRKLDVRQQSHRKMLIDAFINAIFLYDDKMVITFNYKEGTKTITLAELQEAISNKNGSDLDCLVAPKKGRHGARHALPFSHIEASAGLLAQRGHAAHDAQRDDEPDADDHHDERPRRLPCRAEKAVHAVFHAQRHQAHGADAHGDRGEPRPPPAAQQKAQKEHQHARPAEDGQGEAAEPCAAAQVDGDEEDVHTDRGDVRRQAEEDGDAPREHRQHEPDPEHHRRADDVERPGPLGGQQQVQHAAAQGYRREHRREQRGRRAARGGQHLGGLGGKIARRVGVRLPGRRAAKRAARRAGIQLHAAVDTV